MKQRLSVTVMRNSYVTLFKHHYSVPKDYVGKRMNIVFDADTVEIFHVPKLVTAHQRDDTPYEYTQKEAHHLPGRHGSYEKDMEEIYGRAGTSSEASHMLPQHKNIRGRDYYSTTSTTSNKKLNRNDNKY
jgi:putative transposon-encoded protein